VIRRTVILDPGARADLNDLALWIAEAASVDVALAYILRVEAHLRRFDLASERGSRRDDVPSGIRAVGFEGRLTIVFVVDETTVTILGVFRAGQDWAAILADR
jgi:toxin ParE1/3/4